MEAGKRPKTAKRTGRRPGSADTRSEILAAARAEFASHGYEKATVRGIARAANVDSALVHHYFGSKDRVFIAAMEFPIDPSAILEQIAGDPAHVGERLARLAVTLWEAPAIRERMVAMLRAVASNDEMAALLREFARTKLIARIAALLPGPDAELRVELAVSQIVGVAMTRYVIRVEPIASVEADALVGLLGPVLQMHLAPGAKP